MSSYVITMESIISDKSAILKQLEWDFFLERSSRLSLFTPTPDAIFGQDCPPELVEEIFNTTDLFLSPELWDDIASVRSELSGLDESVILTDPGQKLAKGSVFPLEELSNIVSLLETSIRHQSFLSMISPLYEDESFETFKRSFRREILREFRSFVSPDGSIDYFKHPKLKTLRRKQLELEQSIRSTLTHLQNSPEFQESLQFSGHDLINDKYALPIKSDRFSSRLGAIVARSETGRTLFVEPLKVRSLNRERFEIILEIDQIIHRIAQDFSARLGKWSFFVDAFSELAARFDEFDTRARFALEFNLSRPEIVEDSSMQLEGFFHPLIENPVVNRMELRNEDKGVLISGPNTGGKTAAIKAVALTALFAKQGVFVPAKRAKLPLYEKVFYFGNDQQSLADGLSSFAAETRNYAALLKRLGSSNLVVIDEIFNSTSSEEASALAISLFNKITQSPRSKVIVSTHHQTLKTLAHSRQDYISCHVGFDSKKRAPTYKLVYGFPGKSMALEIFQQITAGDDNCREIYNEALKRLDNKLLNYEKLLADLSQKEEKLNRLIQTNESLRNDLKNQKDSAIGIARLKVEEEVTKAKKELERIIEQARSVHRQAQKGEAGGKRSLEKKLASAQSQMAKLIPSENKTSERPTPSGLTRPSRLDPGQKYFCSFINQTVTLKSIAKNGQAVVSKGNMTLKCPADSLWASNASGKSQVVVTTELFSESKLEYDCRGMRLAEFQRLVENAVPDLVSSRVPFINFIHGHGNGALKSWIRSYVKNNPDIKWDQGETGNDGETRLVPS